MKFKHLLSCIFLSSSLLLADNFRNQLIIPSVNINNPFWQYSHKSISQKEDGDFAKLVTKWNQALVTLYTKLNHKIHEEINASIPQIDYYLNDQRFVDAYMNMYRQVYPDIMDKEQTSEKIDENVLNFVNLKFNYLQFHKPITTRAKENISLPATSFGTDKEGHYLIINKQFYNSEKINSLYDLEMANESKYHIESHTNLHKSRAIEYCNLLHFGISFALSNVIHQNDFFTRVLQIFTYNKKQMSKETQRYGAHYALFQSYLESCLQSKNPLEVALYLEPLIDSFNQEFVLLWREFIEDLQNCYDEDDLEAYETLSLQARRAILYTQDDDEDEN